jgi:cytochrome c oxidase assembly protein subunit 15
LLKTAVALLKSLVSSTRLPLYSWLSLISQVLIVVTGGLVRLTASGLGCPTWPKCTADSLTTVPAQGYHGVIEFGNRLLTFALLVIAVLTLISVLRSSARKQLRLTSPSVILFLGIPAQAILGGFTVLTHLNPWLVGSHFVLSGVMIAFASVLVWRVKQVEPQVVPQTVYSLSPALTVFGAIAVVVGVLVTGAGPHSGDASSIRNGLNLYVWQHYHSYPAYAMLALIVVQLVLLVRAKVSPSTQVLRVTMLFLAVTVVQAVIGVVQARLGVPPLLVGLHMAGAASLCSLITFNYLATRAK